MDGSACLLDILDTAGQEEYASLHEQWIRAGRGYLIVYRLVRVCDSMCDRLGVVAMPACMSS